MQIFLIAALVFSLLVAVFAVQNAVQVTVGFLFWNFQTSLVLVILSAAIVGALIIFSVAMFRQFNLTRKIREYEQKVKELDRKVQELESKEVVRQAQVQEGP